MPTRIDPNETVHIEAMIRPPCEAVLRYWESFEPATNVAPELLARAPLLLSTAAWLTSDSAVAPLRNAIGVKDRRALGGLVQLNDYLSKACETLIERCNGLKRNGEWTVLRHEADVAARLAAATARRGDQALALFLLANAHRARDDTMGTIAAYEAAIEAASVGDDDKLEELHKLLAAANDNLGNALADIGRLDEALSRYDEALKYETSREGHAAILTNKAERFIELGMLRSAARTLEDQVKALETEEVSGPQLAVMLDNAASAISGLGETTAALSMLERACALFERDDLKGRAGNALSRSTVHAALGDKGAASRTYHEAHDLAFELARRRIDREHYRRGFHAARAASLPHDDSAYLWYMEGIRAKDANSWGPGLERLQQAATRARDAGDRALALRIDATIAALYADAGQVESAIELASRVRHEAGILGIARPEFMVTATMGALAAGGADIHEALGPLGTYTSAAALLEVHSTIVVAAGLDKAEATNETTDPGAVANELAKLAQEHYADDLAANYFQDAIDKARSLRAPFELANRLTGLRFVLARSGKTEEMQAAATELAALLVAGDLPARGQLVAHRALAEHFDKSNQEAAIDHLRQACATAEGLRQRVPPGPGRADVAREYAWLFHQLARLLRQTGHHTAAFEALQGGKGRRLIDVLAARVDAGASILDAPPNLGEVSGLIGRLGGDVPTVLVDLAIEEDGLTAYLVEGDAAQAVTVPGDLSRLAAGEQGDVREREARLADLCLREPVLSKLAEAVSAAVPDGRRLLIVPDGFLHNFPLHITPVNGSPWCDHFPIGYIPAVGALRFPARGRRRGGQSLVAGDSRGDLCHAATECGRVAAALGTQALVGQQCTRAAIEQTLSAGELDVVHLAVHGRGDARRGGRGSLLLADGTGRTEWVAFEELTKLRWRAELVVFSGCSTGVAGPRQGRELVGVARAALEAGATAVIACLWPVGDEAAGEFMRAFYAALARHRAIGVVDLRLVLDEGRSALRIWLDSIASGPRARRRDGRDIAPEHEDLEMPAVAPALASVLAWGPFMLLGRPILDF